MTTYRNHSYQIALQLIEKYNRNVEMTPGIVPIPGVQDDIPIVVRLCADPNHRHPDGFSESVDCFGLGEMIGQPHDLSCPETHKRIMRVIDVPYTPVVLSMNLPDSESRIDE